MYTIILLRTKDVASFTKYQFVFLNLKIKGELELCFWKQGDKGTYEESLQSVVKELNIKIQEHSEWKLVIYDEECKDRDLDGPMVSLVRLFSGKGSKDDKGLRLEGSFPVQLLYVQSCEKTYIPLTDASHFCYIDEERKFGGNFRMLQFYMESDNGKIESYNEFKLYCTLLSLALGQIPYTFMEAGYLYDVDVEMDRDLLAEYVVMLEGRMDQIKEWQEKEREDLIKRLRSVSPFPEIEMPEVKIEEDHQGMKGGTKKGRILTFLETLKDRNIDLILRQNRELLDTQMFYPKGLLHEESKRIHKMVQELKTTNNFLDEAGKELLERKTQEIIGEMCGKKEVQLKQQKFQEDILDAEELIKSQSVRLMKGRERRLVLSVFAVIELFVFEPYAYQFAVSRESCTTYTIVIICLLAGLATFILVHCGYYGYLYFRHRKSWGFYKKEIFDRLSSYCRDKKRYLEEMMNLILQFQYLEKVRMEQNQLSRQCSLDYDMLEYHFHMLEEGTANLIPLSHLLDEKERGEYVCGEALKIDFTQEPREEDYYRVPFQKESYWMEVNYSGYKTLAAFGFITRLIIKKTICNKEVRDHKDE